jgi:CRISPR/Cas system-associated exonuclease Cas4 (RecB family)
VPNRHTGHDTRGVLGTVGPVSSADPVAAPPRDGPASALSPVQLRTLDALRRSPEPLVFERSFVAELTDDVGASFEQFAERLGDGDELFVTKHRLASVLGCEVKALAPDEFAWSPAVASGQVAHRAIQLLLTWRGEPAPMHVVDEAIARLADADSSLGTWIAGLSAGDEADLRGLAAERVTKFVECFPPLDPRSHPMTEARVQWPLNGPIVLSGKVDLIIGRSTGDESRKVIIDLKTGRFAPRHREDLRFYALVETLRTGIPPRKLASYYLDAGDADVEDVTEGVLRTAARRALDAIHALIELTVEQRPPVKRPGTSCRWCPLLDHCNEGTTHLAEVEAAYG